MMLDKLYDQQKVSYLEILSIDSLGQEIWPVSQKISPQRIAARTP